MGGDRIIVIEVPRAQCCYKPVFIDGNPVSGTYRRNGEGDYHCTEEEMRAMYRDVAEARSGGMSDPRNGILMKMFHLIDIGERAGSGIPSILYVWKQQGWDEPSLSQSFNPNRITVSLPMKKKR